MRALWPDGISPRALNDAAERVRFQLGQSDRFRAGLIRAGTYEAHIAETFANMGLPAELSALPHVESSFDPTAYSKAGAAGLWQFMRSTGRRYMRIDSTVDERMDPYRSTVAAAQLLKFNYDLLGTWPLALTAYNHGASGMRRAKEKQGTDDIVTIIRRHQSRTFGFASRNYYVAFLAALEIDRDPEKYFGALTRHPEVKTQSFELPAYVPASALERTLGVNLQTLRELNPALTAAVWSGDRYVPKGFVLRLPEATCYGNRSRGAAREPGAERAFRCAEGRSHVSSAQGRHVVADRVGQRHEGDGADAAQRSAQRQPGPRRAGPAVAGLGAAAGGPPPSLPPPPVAATAGCRDRLRVDDH